MPPKSKVNDQQKTDIDDIKKAIKRLKDEELISSGTEKIFEDIDKLMHGEYAKIINDAISKPTDKNRNKLTGLYITLENLHSLIHNFAKEHVAKSIASVSNIKNDKKKNDKSNSGTDDESESGTDESDSGSGSDKSESESGSDKSESSSDKSESSSDESESSSSEKKVPKKKPSKDKK